MATKDPASVSETAEKSQTSLPRTKASLLNLPPELRNRIYHYAVPQDRIYLLAERMVFIPIIAPPLAYTCQQLRYEALPLWRSSNSFTLRAEMKDMDAILIDWLSAVAGADAYEDTHLVIEVPRFETVRCEENTSSDRPPMGCCVYDIVVEVKDRQYQVLHIWQDWWERCRPREQVGERAWVYGKAKG